MKIKENNKKIVNENNLCLIEDNNLLVRDIQKVMKATYMITNLFPKHETLASTLQNTVIFTQQCLFNYVRDNNKKSLDKSRYYLYELISLYNVAHSIDIISEMNHQILEKEILKLIQLITAEISLNSNNHIKKISLDHIFDKNNFISIHNDNRTHEPSFEIIKNITKSEKKIFQTTDKKEPIQKNKFSPKKMSYKKIPQTPQRKISLKNKRHENILNILKQKKDASATDVCSLFKDCSSKTIQRDLRELIKNKMVTKKGDRRWATYNLA